MNKKAVIGPVCNGSGKYKKKKCHGCDGTGWITIGVDYPPYDVIPKKPRIWKGSGDDWYSWGLSGGSGINQLTPWS